MVWHIISIFHKYYRYPNYGSTVTKLTLWNLWGYVTDMSKYHGAGVWSPEYGLEYLTFYVQTHITHQTAYSGPRSRRAAGDARIRGTRIFSRLIIQWTLSWHLVGGKVRIYNIYIYIYIWRPFPTFYNEEMHTGYGVKGWKYTVIFVNFWAKWPFP